MLSLPLFYIVAAPAVTNTAGWVIYIATSAGMFLGSDFNFQILSHYFHNCRRPRLHLVMVSIQNKRRRVEDEVRRPKKKIRIRKQPAYHSSSEDEDEVAQSEQPKPNPKSILKTQTKVSRSQEDGESDEASLEGLDELERNTALNAAPAEEDDESEDAVEGEQQELEPSSDEASDADSDGSEDDTSMTSSQARTKKKRNDPAAFATSISKILDTKLTSTKRADPVLSRSKAASDAHRKEADSKLEATARAQLRAERKQSLENGRIKDVLGLESTNVDTGRVLEEERRLKKTAQRGVVRLFNAVRAAQVRADEGMAQAQQEGVVGMRQREERMQEMSKEGFLELISRGGKAGAKA